jgi:MOSC domain-containing protein YiiM
MKTLAELKSTFARSGAIEFIGLRPARREPLIVVEQALVLENHGLKGDRTSRRAGGERQVTFFQFEHLAAIASYLGIDALTPALLRRNIAVSGINVAALKDRVFRVGQVLFRGTGYCHPCSRLEETLGPGGFNACRNHGGITARALSGGTIALGDAVIHVGEELG